MRSHSHPGAGEAHIFSSSPRPYSTPRGNHVPRLVTAPSARHDWLRSWSYRNSLSLLWFFVALLAPCCWAATTGCCRGLRLGRTTTSCIPKRVAVSFGACACAFLASLSQCRRPPLTCKPSSRSPRRAGRAPRSAPRSPGAPTKVSRDLSALQVLLARAAQFARSRSRLPSFFPIYLT